jgi:hypothetical protein
MLKIIIAVTSLVFAYENCSSPTLGSLYDTVKQIKFSRSESLSLVKYKGFSFSAFKPIDGEINENDFYEIGYNDKKQVMEDGMISNP